VAGTCGPPRNPRQTRSSDGEQALKFRWKIFVSHLLVVAVVVAVVAVSVPRIAIDATSSRMGRMGGMMTGVVDDIQVAMQQGLGEALLIGTGLAVLAAVVASYLFSGRLSERVSRLALGARRIAAGDYTERIPEHDLDEFGELARAFNEMSGRLEETERMRKDLLATISHELRTPLGNIQMYMEGLMDGVVPEDPATYQLVNQEAARLSRLVADIQQLTRVEAGVDPPRMTRLDACRVIDAAADAVRPRFENRQLDLQVVHDRGACGVWADEDKLTQVILNLLENSLKYTPAGGSVTLSCGSNGNRTILEVTDTGVGIPEEDLPHIFERFYRVDKSRSLEGGGTGIGLSVSRSLVQQMGGWIEAESREGEGTSFHVALSSDGPARP
jgi:two-component system sensor histidine kinase BaeS